MNIEHLTSEKLLISTLTPLHAYKHTFEQLSVSFKIASASLTTYKYYFIMQSMHVLRGFVDFNFPWTFDSRVYKEYLHCGFKGLKSMAEYTSLAHVHVSTSSWEQMTNYASKKSYIYEFMSFMDFC